MKNMLAAVGLVTIIAVAGLSVVFVMNHGEISDDSEGVSSSDIKTDLEMYAGLLNDPDKNALLYVNADIFFTTGINGVYNYTQPINGTVYVDGLNLVFDDWADWDHKTRNHWTVPYHAIDGVKVRS